MSILRRRCFKIFKIYLLVLISGMQDIVKAFRCQKSRNPCYECISFIIVRSLLQLPVLISLQSSSIGNGMTYCRWKIALASFPWKRNCDKWLVYMNDATLLHKNHVELFYISGERFRYRCWTNGNWSVETNNIL